MANIETLIFDIGNVIYPERWDLVIEKVQELNKNITLEEFKKAYAKKWDDYKVDKINNRDFWKGVASELELPESMWNELSNAFTNIWYEPDKMLAEFLRNLNGKLKIYTLSNSCKENEIRIREDLKNGKIGFINRFYFSHREGFAKPHKEAYTNILRSNHLSPETCIFIDDKDSNVAPAKEIGMLGIVYSNFEQFKEEFELITKKQ